MEKKTLSNLISHNYLKSSLIPIFTVEVILLILYFSMSWYIASKTEQLILQESRLNIPTMLTKQSEIIDAQLKEVENIAKVLQAEHQYLFKNFDNISLPKNPPKFERASNGSFYKTSSGGSSVYWSGTTKIGQHELKKSYLTESFDDSFQSVIHNSKIISAVYLNTHDDMNRIYPYINNIYETYGSGINMEDYNFYYLADQQHNPSRGTVWTDVYLDPAGQGYMLSCVVPVYRGDFLEGVTGLDVTVINFSKNILEFSLPWKSDTCMITKDGEILAMRDSTRELLHIDANETNLLKANPEIGNQIIKVGEYELNVSGDTSLVISKKINTTGWVLVSMISERELFKNINELKNTTDKIGIFAVSLMVLFYLVFFLLLFKYSQRIAGWISRPIVSLAEKTKNIENLQNDDSEISEISVLLSNFFIMSKEILTYRRELESLIAERTDSLMKVMRNLNDSIKYASFIQRSILPKEELLNELFKDHFLLWKPRDIVGGDIYFIEKLSDDEVVLFVIDCTGHGIPGAFVTLLVKGLQIPLLQQIDSGQIEKSSTSAMLHFFNKQIKDILKQHKNSSSDSDVGFDGAVLYYNRATGKVKISGANSVSFIISNSNSSEIIQLKGDRESVGYKRSRESFNFKEIEYDRGEGLKIYLLTDGFIDQKSHNPDLFNFGRQRLEDLLKSVQNKSMNDQKDIIHEALVKFMDGTEQRDDITLIGIEI